MFSGVSHIGIAVKDLDQAVKTYSGGLGAIAGEVHNLSEMKVIMLTLGTTKLELMEPVSAEGPIGKFIANRGEGVHHICIEVDNIEKELAGLAARGVRLVDSKPRHGIEGKIAFLHPKAMNGVLIELVQKEV